MKKDMADESPMTSKKLLIIIIELILVFLIAVVLVGVFQQFLLSTVQIKGDSMFPTISDGDKVWVLRPSDNFKIGDVIVFYKPNNIINDNVIESNNEKDNPSSKKTTFTEFLRKLPIIGIKISTSDENKVDNSNEYKAIIKRIVAGPGDTVCFELVSESNGNKYCQLFINGEAESTFLYENPKFGLEPMKLGSDEYFVLGDNRGNSHDSEDYGPIKKNMIFGKAVVLNHNGKLKTSF